MKKLIGTLIVAAFCTTVFAQDAVQTKAQEMDAVKAQVKTPIDAAVEQNMAQIQAKIGEAKNAMVQAKSQLANLSDNAKKDAADAIKAQTMTKLQDAIKACEQAQNRVKEADEEIQTRLQTKAAELKEIQDRLQTKSGDGSGKDE